MRSTSRYLHRTFRNSDSNYLTSTPLRHKICWRWCVRYTALVTIWAFITTYIWISSRASCDSGLAHTSQPLSVGKAFNSDPRTSQNNNQDSRTKNGNLDSLSENENRHAQPKHTNTLSTDVNLLNTSSTGQIYFNRELIQQLEKNAEHNTLSSVYQKNWVGFHEIAGSDCQKALHAKGSNSAFPQTVNRTRPSQYILDSENCEKFLHKYGFNRYPAASKEEKEFPIAFIILFYKDLDQVLFLLRALYQLHNVYCLSVDTKSSIELLEAVRSVTRCLPNVFVASKLENIVYAGFTRLMADIDCMDDLLKHPVQWKYVINMPGTQFPLRNWVTSRFTLVEMLRRRM